MAKHRKTQGRFDEHVSTLARMISERHGLTVRRSKKRSGLALSDPRIMQTVVEHVNRQLTDRGDGMTLCDLAGNANLKRILKRESKTKRSRNHVETKRSRNRS